MGMIAVDRVAVDRPFMESQLVNFVKTDTIWYQTRTRLPHTASLCPILAANL